MIRRLATAIIASFIACAAYAQGAIQKDFVEASDSLRVLLEERTTVKTDLKLDRVLRRSNVLDFYFSQELGDYPWRKSDIDWFRTTLKSLFPSAYSSNTIGNIYVRNHNLNDYATPALGFDGKPAKDTYHYNAPGGTPLVRRVGAQANPKGLDGRHIALWQSHGRYFEESTDRWEWQRAPTHGTVEDLYTQSIVLPFLMPMLENAGAYILSPRERDLQEHEVIIDNDPAFTGERAGLLRRVGIYTETGDWSNAGIGFADSKRTYMLGDTPFKAGSARQTGCVESAGDGYAIAKWSFTPPEKGSYAVYVSYKTLNNSSDAAHYTVHHAGGSTEFYVNQQMGGSTWIYLGTFPFDSESRVTLDNVYPSGKSMPYGCVVTADAVKIGGGVGKTARGVAKAPQSSYTTSGMASYLEGALYWMQWAGAEPDLTINWADDYTKDFAGRGRTYADLVQSQICNDIRAEFNPEWSRREIWDRSYSEARTTSVPGIIVENLAHQNLADMQYGLNPDFKFTLARAIYKGVLKFLSNEYNREYVVQPLPVNSIAVLPDGDGSLILKWKPTKDQLEPTADAKSYIVYTRLDDGFFDDGVPATVKTTEDGWVQTSLNYAKGHIYSFKVVAVNEGGKSFPSQIVSFGVPDSPTGSSVMVVNNFDRVSGPTWFDSETYGGFLYNEDGGVGYINDISFIGEVYEFRRDMEWIDDDNPGWGGSSVDKAGTIIPGNTFDYAKVHGRALMAAGRPFYSVSAAAWEADPTMGKGTGAVDIICGKQVKIFAGPGKVRYAVFPAELQSAIRSYTSGGGNVLISGANIATDVWDRVFPIEVDKQQREQDIKFVQEVLGYKWHTGHGSYTGQAAPAGGGKAIAFHRERNAAVYHVENPDGIVPADDKGVTTYRYTGNNVPAAVQFTAKGYKVASFGFPLETVTDYSDMEMLIRDVLTFFGN